MLLLTSKSFFFLKMWYLMEQYQLKVSFCKGLSRQTELLITPYSLEPVLSGHPRHSPLNTVLIVVFLIISNARLIIFSL